MWTFLHKLSSPPFFYELAAKMIPWFAASSMVLIAYGTIAGLFLAPPDYQQGDAFRIIYVHVPSAYLSMMAYALMAVAAATRPLGILAYGLLIERIGLRETLVVLAVVNLLAPLVAWLAPSFRDMGRPTPSLDVAGEERQGHDLSAPA